jgi:hypothetical protein
VRVFALTFPLPRLGFMYAIAAILFTFLHINDTRASDAEVIADDD